MEATAASITGRLESLEVSSASRPSRPTSDREQSGVSQKEIRAPSADISLDQAVSELSLKFDFNVEIENDQISGRRIVKVLSPDGKTVLQEMPPEAAQQLALKARSGALLNLLNFVA
jgi:uncharacterized FlaG/YvyC family protein